MKGILNRIIVILGFLTFFYVAFNRNDKFRKFVKDAKRTVENIEVDEVESRIKDFVVKEVKKRVPESVERVVDVVTELTQYNESGTPVYNKSRKVSRKAAVVSKSSVTANLNGRQNEILNKLGKKRELAMSDVAWDFPSVSQRTLRRDFDKLESLGLIAQFGKTKNSKYVLKNP